MNTLIIVAIILLVLETILFYLAYRREKLLYKRYQSMYMFMVEVLARVDAQHNKPEISKAVKDVLDKYKP